MDTSASLAVVVVAVVVVNLEPNGSRQEDVVVDILDMMDMMDILV